MYIRRNRILPIAGGAVTALALGLLLVFNKEWKTVRLRSDSTGIEYVTQDGKITCVNINGQFPYLSIVPKSTERRETDSAGNITETYAIEAEFSLNHRNTMKLFIKTSNEVTYTYILKFADKDVTIKNGEVVE